MNFWTFWHTIFAPAVGTVTIITIAALAVLRAIQYAWLCIDGIREQRRKHPLTSFEFSEQYDWAVERDEAAG